MIRNRFQRFRITPHRAGDLLCLALYATVALLTVRSMGVVGEVAASWLPEPPETRVVLEDPGAGLQRIGPLVARSTRPTESLDLPGLPSLPLAVNAYTGGPPDWPALLVAAISPPLALWVAPALGGALLLLARRFLRFHGSDGSALGAGLLLATDWCFHFYRKALGGTEVLAMAASLLLVWALWSRRWRGGVHGTWAISVAVGLGLLAKITFVAPLAALGIATLLTRWDRALLPPAPIRLPALLLPPLLLTAPLWITALHHAAADLPPLPSHDAPGLQADRLIAGLAALPAAISAALTGAADDRAPAREALTNLPAFLLRPASTLAAAWGCPETPLFSPLRALGHAFTLLGVSLSWRERQPVPADALLRYLSLAVPLSWLLLTLLNRDLHHLAQTTVLLALLTALAAARLAQHLAPRPLRPVLTALLLLPHLLAGVGQLRETDALLAQSPVPTLSAPAQRALVAQIRAALPADLPPGATLYVVDYESYGMLEFYRADLPPGLHIVHLWPAAARRVPRPDLLAAARGGYLLTVRASAPFIYNWRPAAAQLPGAVPLLQTDSFSLYEVPG